MAGGHVTSTEIIAIIVSLGAVLINPVMTYLTLRATQAVGKGVTEVHQVVNSKNDALVARVAELEHLLTDLRNDRTAAQRVASDLAVNVEKDKEIAGRP
jgi:cell division protein FtsB